MYPVLYQYYLCFSCISGEFLHLGNSKVYLNLKFKRCRAKT